MRKHIKEAWLARLTPEWWARRARNRFREHNGSMCANGVLCDVIDPTQWEAFGFYRFPNGTSTSCAFPSLVNDAIGYSVADEGAVIRANDRADGTYEMLLAAVRAVPEDL